MNAPSPALSALGVDCAGFGLVILGVLHPDEEDGLAAGTLALIGNAGSAMWRAFSQSGEFTLPAQSLDRWSRRVFGAMAEKHHAQALFPFGGPPYHPFQRWALRAGGVSASPLGVLVHPRYGPWFAYRGALLFKERLDIAPAAPADPCGACREKPCLHACPVGAIDIADGYDAASCRAHVSHRNNKCFSQGCAARHACPLGGGYVYLAEQAQFHMQSFIA